MNDDFVLPSWIGKIVAVIVFAIALGLIYYGIHDGIICNEIAYRTKAGKASVSKEFNAVVIGAAFAGLGIALLRGAFLIFKSSRTKN